MIKKIDHLVITTINIKKCIAFYKKIGFECKNNGDKYELFTGNLKINVHIKGKELLPHAKNVSVGSCDICFEIDDDIGDFKEYLLKENINIESDIVLRNGVHGTMQSIYIRDFDGNLLEFSKYEEKK